MTPTRRAHAPSHLAAATARWWESVVDEYDLEQHHVRILTLAAEAFDRATQARKEIAANGLVFLDRFGAPHPRPEVAIERDARVAYLRAIRELDLDAEAGPAPRPPRRGR